MGVLFLFLYSCPYSYLHRMVVIAVGPHSFHGKTLIGLQVESEETPLQVKLDGLAEMIAKIGLAAALLMFLILLLEFLINTYAVGRFEDPGKCPVISPSPNATNNGTTNATTIRATEDRVPLPLPSAEEVFDTIIAIIIQSLTILVVAVPEGLPMAVTIALAFATTRMLKV
jgi:Ca2+-transporting ATPase